MTKREIKENARTLKFTLLQRGVNEDWISSFLTNLILIEDTLTDEAPSYDKAATIWNICDEYHSKTINEGWTWDGAVKFIQENWNNPDLQIKKENLKNE